GQLAQVAHAGIRLPRRTRGVRPGAQQLHHRAGRHYRLAGLPRPQLHGDRRRPAVESRPPHLRPAAAMGRAGHAGVRAAAAGGGDSGGGGMSGPRFALALLGWLLMLPALAQEARPNTDDMMDRPPSADPRGVYWADVLSHVPRLTRRGRTWYAPAAGPGVTVYCSKDRATWQAEPQVFAEIPAWAYTIVPGFNGHIWAPDISHHDGTYYLYYSISSGGRNTSAIGVATNRTLDRSDPAFEWVDHGIVLRSV